MIVSILAGSLASVVHAILITLVAWLLLLIALGKINRHHIRTFWFWALSLFLIPLSVVSLSLILAAGHIQKDAVCQAQEYAMTLVQKVNSIPVADEVLPENVISSVINRFPSLEYFLENRNIDCDTDKGLVDSLFAAINRRIDRFQRKTGTVLGVSVAVFLGIVTLAGFLRKRRKERNQLMIPHTDGMA